MRPPDNPSHIILCIVALALIRYGWNSTHETQGAHSASNHRNLQLNELSLAEYTDPKSITLRGRRVLDQLQSDLDEQAGLLANPFAEQQTDIMNELQQSQANISYVTSFWAERRGIVSHPHRLEIKAALLANILNPHFNQVVIFLDGISEEASCAHFLEEMKDLSLQLGEVSVHRMFNNTQADPFSRVTCVGLSGGQPSYYQMFQNTLHEAVTSDIVVLANADQAFDDTMSLARFLNPEVLLVLGTRGYSEKISPDARALYEELVGRNHPMYLTEERPDRCLVTPGSVDTWIFHRKMIMGRLKEIYFQRLNIRKEMEFFYMNEMQAENAALWALNQCVTDFTSVYNACDRIHSWHFHLTPKTHSHATSWGRVPQPWSPPFPSKTPKCITEGNCFLKM